MSSGVFISSVLCIGIGIRPLYAGEGSKRALQTSGQDQRPELLQTGGVYHGDEITAEDGQKWFGLFSEEGKWVLKERKITVRTMPDDLYDETPKTATGKSVSVEGETRQPLLLIRNLPVLKDGPVDSVFPSPEENILGTQREGLKLFPGMTKRLSLHKRECVLFASGKAKQPEATDLWVHPGIVDYQLHLFQRGEGISNSHGFIQIPLLGGDTQPPTLLWAGDLDRDDRLDLFLSTSNHYNVSEFTLFLSSSAPSDRLIGTAAVFSTTGC